MPTINIYKRPGTKAHIEQTKVQRDWMDLTAARHAYKCFPVTLANSVGLSISFTEDIEFVWDGILDSTPDHVKIIRAPEHVCTTGRANATVSFNCDFTFRTDESMSMISIVPPNFFIDGAVPFTSVISTSFHDETFPIAWRITRPNHNIVIPAGTPVATLIPLSLKGLSEIEFNMYDKPYDPDEGKRNDEKIAVWAEKTKDGGFTNFYRDAVDYNGNKLGQHEVKGLHLKINDFTTK